MNNNNNKAITLLHTLEQHSKNQPEKIAVTFLDESVDAVENITFFELIKRAKVIAANLNLLEIKNGKALVLYPPGIDFIVTMLGCFYAGFIAIPTYPPTSKKTSAKLTGILKNAEPNIILTTSAITKHIDKLDELNKKETTLKVINTDNIGFLDVSNFNESHIDPEQIAFLQYTSGSTDSPKGVMVRHRNLLANAIAIENCFGLQQTDNVVSWLPPYHDMGLVGTILAPLYTGCQTILFSPADFIKNPKKWLETISKYQGNASGGPNFAYQHCVNKITDEEKTQFDLSSWRIAFNGAEPVNHATLIAFENRFKANGFNAKQFFPCYGLAESTLLVTGIQGVHTVSDNSKSNATLVSSGVVDDTITIVNPETHRVCTENEVGEIWLNSESIALGYWNQSEINKKSFGVTLPEQPEKTFFRTGDLGFIKDNKLFVNGRIKDLIIINGSNHYPQDIEHTVNQANSALTEGDSAAFSIEKEGHERLAILVEVSRHTSTEKAQEIFTTIETAIWQQHELAVDTIILIPLTKLPRTTSGKIQHFACKQALLTNELMVVAEWRADKQTAANIEANVDEASKCLSEFNKKLRLKIQQELADILTISSNAVETHKNFAELGLDSLMAGELENRIYYYLKDKIQIPAQIIFEYSTIAKLADEIESRINQQMNFSKEGTKS